MLRTFEETPYKGLFVPQICGVPQQRAFETIQAPASSPLDFQLVLVILHDLLEAQGTRFSGTWIGEWVIPGAALSLKIHFDASIQDHRQGLDPSGDDQSGRPQ